MNYRKKLKSTTLGLTLFCCFYFDTAYGEENWIDLEFRVFPLNRNVLDGLYYRRGSEEIAPLEFASRRRSLSHDYRGPPVITFYTKISDHEEGVPPYRSIGSVNIPEGIKEPLFFFLPLTPSDSEESTDYKILAMDDSPQSFPYGHVRVLNASGAPLSGRVGDQDIKLDFEVSPAWSSKSLYSRDGSWVNLALFVQVRDDFEMVYANQLTFASDARSILVIRPPRRENSLKVTSYILEDYRKVDESGQLSSLP